MFLIDTDVVSELREAQRADPGALRSFQRFTVQNDRCFLSAITVGEPRRGMELLSHRGDASRASRLEAWLDGLLIEFADRVLPVDREIGQLWGRLRVPAAENPLDELIAATALINGLTVVTRNVRHQSSAGNGPGPRGRYTYASISFGSSAPVDGAGKRSTEVSISSLQRVRTPHTQLPPSPLSRNSIVSGSRDRQRTSLPSARFATSSSSSTNAATGTSPTALRMPSFLAQATVRPPSHDGPTANAASIAQHMSPQPFHVPYQGEPSCEGSGSATSNPAGRRAGRGLVDGQCLGRAHRFLRIVEGDGMRPVVSDEAKLLGAAQRTTDIAR